MKNLPAEIMQNLTGQEEVKFVVEPKLEITAAIDQDNLSNNKTYNAEKPFQCEFCARVYEKVKQLKKHQYRCIQKPKVLRKCEEIYGSTHLYELVIENNKSNPQCFICEKVFSDKWVLTNHVKFVHEKKKNYEIRFSLSRKHLPRPVVSNVTKKINFEKEIN